MEEGEGPRLATQPATQQATLLLVVEAAGAELPLSVSAASLASVPLSVFVVNSL